MIEKLRTFLFAVALLASSAAAAEPQVVVLAARLLDVDSGFVDLRLETELLLGRLELTSAPAAGERRLAAVEREASERGFRLLAAQAAAARRAALAQLKEESKALERTDAWRDLLADDEEVAAGGAPHLKEDA